MTYPEAIEWMAKRANMELPKSEETPAERIARERKEKATAAARAAAYYYYEELYGEKGEKALAYLAKRGIDPETATAFGMGYSPSAEGLLDALTAKGYSTETMLSAGLIAKNGADFLAGRLIIPIINGKGAVIGFGGRSLDAETQPKYKNTGGTILFDKRYNLFAINLFRKNLVTEKFDSLILVEGYMDVISLYQAGIRNAVASMGTSLTPEQCAEIRKQVALVYVFFDGDTAGRTATIRSLDLLESVGLEVRVVIPDEGLDPDDTVKKSGKEGIIKLIDGALPLTEFKIKTVASEFDVETPEGRRKFALGCVPILKKLDPISRNSYIKMVSDISGLSPESIANSILNSDKAEAAPKKEAPQDVASPEERMKKEAARFILASAAALKDYVGADALDPAYFEQYPFLKAVYGYICSCVEKKKRPLFGDIVDLAEGDGEEIELFRTALDNLSEAALEAHYKGCIDKLESKKRKERSDEILSLLKSMKDGEEKQKLQRELIALTKKK